MLARRMFFWQILSGMSQEITILLSSILQQLLEITTADKTAHKMEGLAKKKE